MSENPYAFPMPGIEYEDGDPQSRSHKHPGMELRDYFAGQALIGWLSGLDEANVSSPGYQMFAAGICYGFADAMLAARHKSKATEQDGGR